ncbi:hypothetical protein BLS_000865 [Venturia inaequalis]|uniref:Carbohydrate esterase family 16 protein n=1 Tax=Venturia inaequalis TaxID=5025 RepID=A0A8H3UWR5_VENIN|nr:hypothetical protein EG327_000635 [Venturia inaequalis]KAE9978089.1 hypothetical protein BLS_000865 [Venturia inaequalis]KAE9987333.1 hypothetical protein EG328_003057 [Venturia inaequalis]RDI84634.1 hypothetical protein Vi05172_g5365 [Venturia inaequalis]
MQRPRLIKVYFIAALGIASILYLSWIYPTLHVKTHLVKTWAGTSRRIVVFGDSFSDTGIYLIDPPKEDDTPIRDPAAGQRWTETLCEEFVCDGIHNFARSTKDPEATYSGGAVIDNDIYVKTTQNDSVLLGLLPDLKAQVQHWLRWEERRAVEAADDESEEETIFAISFGFYDIFQYAILDLGDAQNAITQSMHVLFQQLDIIAEHSSSAPQVLISGLWDVTFAPHFQSLSLSENNTLPQFGGAQHKMIYLVEYWNSALIQTSMTWSKGDVFYLNWQNWVMDQIRTTQLHDLNIVDSSGNGKETVVFDDVTSPCLLRSSADNSIACARPERNLFWDQAHFSGRAHNLLGKEAVKVVESNWTTNAEVRSQPSKAEGITTNQLIHLIPSLAPGY